MPRFVSTQRQRSGIKDIKPLWTFLKTKLSFSDMQIFRDEKNITLREDEDMELVESEITENDNIILRQVFLLAKSVPRQSNRTKWQERSGFQPNLLQELP